MGYLQAINLNQRMSVEDGDAVVMHELMDQDLEIRISLASVHDPIDFLNLMYTIVNAERMRRYHLMMDEAEAMNDAFDEAFIEKAYAENRAFDEANAKGPVEDVPEQPAAAAA